MANPTNIFNSNPNPSTQVNPSGSSKGFQKWMIAPIAGVSALVLGGAGYGAYALSHNNGDKSPIDNDNVNPEDDNEVVNAEIIDTNLDDEDEAIEVEDPEVEDPEIEDPYIPIENDEVEPVSSVIGTRIETSAIDEAPAPNTNTGTETTPQSGNVTYVDSETTTINNTNNYNVNVTINNPGAMPATSSQEVQHYVTFDPTQIHQAHSVNDEMSFAQAFAAAREEVGPGGVFVWHGNVYGTYYADEWNSMTPDQQYAFSSSFHYGGSSNHHSHHNDQFAHHHHEDPAPIVHDPNEVALVTDEEDEGLMLIGQEYNAENDMHLAYVTDGHNVAMFADVDNDGTYDYYVADFDGNGEITNNEIIDISDQGLSINDVAGLPQFDDTDPYDIAMS